MKANNSYAWLMTGLIGSFFLNSISCSLLEKKHTQEYNGQEVTVSDSSAKSGAANSAGGISPSTGISGSGSNHTTGTTGTASPSIDNLTDEEIGVLNDMDANKYLQITPSSTHKTPDDFAAALYSKTDFFVRSTYDDRSDNYQSCLNQIKAALRWQVSKDNAAVLNISNYLNIQNCVPLLFESLKQSNSTLASAELAESWGHLYVLSEFTPSEQKQDFYANQTLLDSQYEMGRTWLGHYQHREIMQIGMAFKMGGQIGALEFKLYTLSLNNDKQPCTLLLDSNQPEKISKDCQITTFVTLASASGNQTSLQHQPYELFSVNFQDVKIPSGELESRKYYREGKVDFVLNNVKGQLTYHDSEEPPIFTTNSFFNQELIGTFMENEKVFIPAPQLLNNILQKASLNPPAGTYHHGFIFKFVYPELDSYFKDKLSWQSKLNGETDFIDSDKDTIIVKQDETMIVRLKYKSNPEVFSEPITLNYAIETNPNNHLIINSGEKSPAYTTCITEANGRMTILIEHDSVIPTHHAFFKVVRTPPLSVQTNVSGSYLIGDSLSTIHSGYEGNCELTTSTQQSELDFSVVCRNLSPLSGSQQQPFGAQMSSFTSEVRCDFQMNL